LRGCESSIGEYASLAIAGTIGLEDALLFVAKRALLMTTNCEPEASGMMACRMSAAEIREILTKDGCSLSCLTVACENSPQDSVVAGPLGPLGQLAEICQQKGVKHKLLPVPFGFHSAAMDPILEDLRRHASSISFRPCLDGIRVGSSLYGRLLSADEDMKPEYFVQQTRESVQFSRLAKGLDEFLAGSDASVLEVGPAPISKYHIICFLLRGPIRRLTLDISTCIALPLLRAAFQTPAYLLLATLKPSAKPWVTLASLLQSLYLQGHAIRWREVYDGTSPKFLRPFPRYPLAGSEFVIPFRELPSPDALLDKDQTRELHPPFEFLAPRGPSVTDAGATFETPTKKLSKFIKAHAVGGVPLCPASVYMEFSLEALSVIEDMSPAVYVMENIAFDKPLVYSEGNQDTIRLEIARISSAESQMPLGFSFKSQKGQVYCTGHFATPPSHLVDEIFVRREAYVKRQRLSSFDSEHSRSTERFSRKTIYQVVFPRVVAYAEPFLTLDHLTISATGLEGHGRFKLAAPAVEGQFICPPAFIDTMLHSAGFIANTKVEPEVACICTKVDRAILPSYNQELYQQEMEIYCSLMDIGDAIVADAYVLEAGHKVVSCVEGMYFKKIQLASFKAHLSRVARNTDERQSSSAIAKLSLGDEMRTRPAVEQAAAPRQVPNVEETVHSILRSVCGAHGEIKASSTLNEMGVDSLLLIELAHSICSHYPELGSLKSDLEGCATIGDLVNIVTEAAEKASSLTLSTPRLTYGTPPNSVSTPDSASTPDSTVSRAIHTPVESFRTPGSTGAAGGSPMEALFLDVCGLRITESEKNTSLSSLGVDSLLSLELLSELHNRFGIIIHEGHEVISDLTFRRLEGMHRDMQLTATPSPEKGPPYSRQNNVLAQQQTRQLQQQLNPLLDEMCKGGFPMELQVQKVGAPTASLYLFHDGSGVCNMYRRLPDMNRTVLGIFSLDLALIDPSIQKIEDLARLYIDRAHLASESNVVLGGDYNPNNPA
jgi:iterative type I PKS product template protein